jgi:hypothetical protein
MAADERVEAVVAARERDPRPVTLVLVAIVLIAAAGGLLVIAGEDDAIGEYVGQPAGFARPEENAAAIITELDRINDAKDPTGLQGRHVALRDIGVQSVVGDYTFWAGPNAEAAVAVVLLGELTARQAEGQTRLLPGQRADIFGIIRVPARPSVFRLDELLDPAEKARLRQSQIYIDASRVTVVP